MAHPKKGYFLPDGSRIPGTTTIISRFKDSGALMYWACEQGKAIERGEISNLYDKRDAAGDSGTAVHFLVRRHTFGLPPLELDKLETLVMDGDGILELNDDNRQQVQSGLDAYIAWERMTKLKIVHQEIQLVSEEHQFGGCPDAVGRDPTGRIVLLDWKTSKGIYPAHKFQLAAYEQLWNENRPDMKVQRRGIVRIGKDSADDFEVAWMFSADAEWRVFKKRLELYYE